MDLFAFSQNLLRRSLVRRGVRSSVTTALGQVVHFYELAGTGSGPPIVLVHGLAGSANGFYRLFSGLARRFSKVIAPDLPGHGFSPLPARGALPLLEQYAVLKAFVEDVVRDPAFVVGNSLGGAMAITLAHEEPRRVRALGLVAPGGARVAPERFQEVVRTMQVKSDADARILTRRLFHRPPFLLLALTPVLRSMYDNPCIEATFASLTEGGYIAPEVLSSLSMPTLLLWGKSEKHLPFEGIDYFRAHLPQHARVEVVEGFGHVPQVERPEALLKRLLQFADEARI